MRYTRYTVRTFHNTGYHGDITTSNFRRKFVVPVTIEAASHFEAATKRFDRLPTQSQRSTLALLVTVAEDEPRIYFTENTVVETRKVVKFASLG